MKKCKYCSKEFEPKNPKGVFCSDNCRVYFGRRKFKIGQKIGISEITGVEEKQDAIVVTGKILNSKHRLWKEGDPNPNTMSFLRKYDCMNYEELEEKQKL